MIERLYIGDSGEEDTEFNLRVKVNDEILRSVIGALKTLSQEEISIIRLNSALQFLVDSRLTLQDVCNKNIKEFERLLESEEDNIFHNYIEYTPEGDNLVIEGKTQKQGVGYRMVGKYGEEMIIRFAIPEGLILDEDYSESEIMSWLESIKEVNVEHRQRRLFGYRSKLYRISQDGLQRVDEMKDEYSDKDLEILQDQKARIALDREDIKDIETLYGKLSKMKVTSFTTSRE